MKILYITLINKEGSLARNQQQLIHFISKLGRYTDLHVFNRYKDLFQNVTQVPYIEGKKIKDIVLDVKPDLLLCYRTKRMINEDSVTDVPVVFIEQEFALWKSVDLMTIVQKHNTKAMILTGYFPETEQMLGIPIYWLPFSVNEEIFYTDQIDHSQRKKEIAFFGVAPSYRIGGTWAYKVRRKAIQTLTKNGLMSPKPHMPDNKRNKWFVNPSAYPKKLKSYFGALSCAFNSLEQMPLKSLEIMASGTALLTQAYKPEITQTLFGSNPPYFTYKKDMSNIVQVAQKILEDDDYRIETCKRALHLVNTRHLHKHRVLELYEILQAVLEKRRHKSQQFSYI